jgi:hypothetical protein
VTYTPTNSPTHTPCPPEGCPTATATPTSLKSDIDLDTIPGHIDPDDDNDGCTDARELGSIPILGGLRNPNSFWDFFDVPDMSNQRDRAITVGDIARVVTRFGSSGTATSAADALAAPAPPPAYHAGSDRTLKGPEPWNTTRPNGGVTIEDIALLVAQFGHSCV